MPNKISLDMIRVASPCSEPWDRMIGDEQVRFCRQCQQHVYNLSEMTQADAEALVMKREGKLCVRFFARFDGTMITKDCPVGWRAVKRRMAMVGAAAAAVLFAMLGVLTLGAFAATRENPGPRAANPIRLVWDWLFPPPPVCVMGEPIPIGPAPGGAPLPVEQEND